MATYKQIQTDIQARYGRTVKTCWIAHVKELNGLRMSQAPNRRSPDSRAHPCPADIRPLSEESMHRFDMLR